MRLFKLIIIVIFLFPSTLFAGSRNDYLMGAGVTPEPCSAPTGTYEWAWTGEHVSGTNYACLNSGAATDQATNTDAGVITATGAISGTYEMTFNADNEDVLWSTAMPTNIESLSDTSGWVRFKLITPASLEGISASQPLIHLYPSADYTNNRVYIYIDSDGQLAGERKASGATDIVADANTAVATSTTYEIVYTWDQANGEHAIILCNDGACSAADIAGCVAANTCDNDSEAMDVMNNNIDTIQIGTSIYGTLAFTFLIDDIIIGTGYIGP